MLQAVPPDEQCALLDAILPQQLLSSEAQPIAQNLMKSRGTDSRDICFDVEHTSVGSSDDLLPSIAGMLDEPTASDIPLAPRVVSSCVSSSSNSPPLPNTTVNP